MGTAIINPDQWASFIGRSWYTIGAVSNPSLQKTTIRETLVFESSESWRSDNNQLPMRLPAFVAWMKEVLEDVPEEFRDSVVVELEHEGDYDGPGYAEFHIYYDRDETDEELADRENERIARQESEARAQEGRERAEFERLKAKFGD